MPGQRGSSTFCQKIQQRLDAAQAKLDEQRDAMDSIMVELEWRNTLFEEIAERLMGQVLRPALEAFSEHLDNAQLVDSGSPYFLKCELSRCVRFPADAHIAFAVTHDDAMERLTVEFEAHILPVFIRYERSDVVDQQLHNVEYDVVRQWAETKLLGFLDSYLLIETHEQYQRDNVAVDPVCGMKVTKPRGLAREFEGRTYYFCAQHCLERFAQDPRAFVPHMPT